MNKNRYRIVFNQARNLMMAVAENTSSQGKGRQGGSGQAGGGGAGSGANVIELFQFKALTFFTLCLFGLQPVLLQAQVVADANAPANKKPTIDSTANGVPLVQIVAPSAGGVSHNMYNQFNVGTNGVILNNSQGVVQTQLGGYVTGNPNLANGTAKIILNEVTGPGASTLLGYTEVAGLRAEVIIANPNGIVCNGCGFINTSRGILTTGVPLLGNGGSLDSFRVTGGQITIGEGGLNAANTDQLDLISRSLQVNGKIWANTLNAIVGTNKVDYATLGVQVIAGDADKPTLGIDVALLGGMYANKIRLVGTEAGVGVNSQGTLAAQAGDFSLDNQGNITLSGHTKASGNIAITTTSDLNNSGTLDGKTITTTSNSFNNSFEVLGDTVTINAATLNNQTIDSKISANISADLNISGDITNQGMIQAYNVTTTSNDFNNTGAVLGAAVKINAVNLNNTSDTAVIAATKRIDLLISNSVSNTDGATIWSLGDLNAAKSGTLDAFGYLTDNMVSFTNSSGTVQADGDLRISADSITNKRTKFDPIADVKYSDWATDNVVINGADTDGVAISYKIYNRTESIIKENVTTAAMLLSGGNMWLKGSILNEYSTVAAGKDLSFNGYSTSDTLGAVTESKPEFSFKQVSRNLMTEEKKEGTKDNWKWVVTGEKCDIKFGGIKYNCRDVKSYLNFPVPYLKLNETVADSVSASASFTAGGDITGSAKTLDNLNKGKSSITLGAIKDSTPTLENPTPLPLDIILPKNGLFKYNTAPGHPYLIETNPLFANYKTFISSDYMLSKLNLDPAQTQKRLGDAFYEQKLVSDQITNLTGRRFLPGYTSAEAEFIALMDQGLAEAHAQNLIPGVTLTAAQVAALTYDIVWMVSRDIKLPNGAIEKLLVPQVFLTRLRANDLRRNGSLIAAQNINIKTSGTLQNSGTILGSQSTTLNATDIINQGTIKSNGDTRLNASHDIKNQSGTISGVRVAVLAGHDLINETDTEELQLGNVFTTNIHDTASISATDTLDMEAGNDITVTAANIASGGNANITAGNNLTIQAKAATERASIAANTGASGGISQTTHLLSQVQTGGNLNLQAKNEVNLAAARINAEQKLNVAAKNINITAVKDKKNTGSGLTTDIL